MINDIHNSSWPSGLSTPPEMRRHERRDAMEHRHRILQVAQNLFAKHGVQAVSMHQIAKEAGVGQGTLYRRYANKGELCMDLLREHHEQLMQDIEALFMTKANAPVLERLDGVLALSVAFLEEQGPMLGPVAMTELHEAACNDIPREPYLPFYLWLHNLFAGLLNDAVECEEIAELDIDFTADAILATLNPMFYHLQRYERGYSPERILQGIRHIYVEGLRASHHIQ